MRSFFFVRQPSQRQIAVSIFKLSSLKPLFKSNFSRVVSDLSLSSSCLIQRIRFSTCIHFILNTNWNQYHFSSFLILIKMTYATLYRHGNSIYARWKHIKLVMYYKLWFQIVLLNRFQINHVVLYCKSLNSGNVIPLLI